jgi:hypothetical protein
MGNGIKKLGGFTTMKKQIALALAVLMLALTLAACGGDTSPTPGGNNDPTPQQNESPAPAPDNGGNGDTIPDNGTPPNPPAPFNSHTGDKAYFYKFSDDYLIFMYDVSLEEAGYGMTVTYGMVSFESFPAIMRQKLVFENDIYAEKFLEDNRESYGDYGIAIENVVYDTRIGYAEDTQRMVLLPGQSERDFWIGHYKGLGFEVYLSKP